MQTQSSKKSRGGKAAASRPLSKSMSDSIRGIPSLTSMKEEAIRAFKDSASEKLGTFSEILPEGMADDVAVYAQQAVRWLRKNPGAATALAVLSGVAVGAVVRQALIGENALSKSSS